MLTFEIIMTDKNLKMKATSGVFWNGLSQFSTQIFQLVVIMILARLLTPEDFGVVGLATLFTGLVGVANELGLSAAIIQRKDVDDMHLSTSFWANIIMGLTLFTIFFLMSPFIASFFKEDILRQILIVSSLGLVIGSFGIIHKALLEKGLDFKRAGIVDICAAFMSGTVSILLAINDFGVWSIVFGSIAGSIVSVMMLWRMNRWRPSLKFSFMHFKDLFRFGGNVMGSKFVGYIAMRIDYLVVGKLLGTAPLGYYSLARNLTSFPVQKISWTVMRVAFPIFSSIQDNSKALKEGYLKTIKYVSLATFPMLAGMFIVAPEFVPIFYGEKWSPVIILLQILSIEAAFVSIGTMTNIVQYAKGRSDIQFKWQVYTTVTLPIAIVVGTKYGIVGVAIMLTIMMAIYILIIQIITNRLIGIDMYSLIKEIAPSTICSTVLVVGIFLYKKITFVGNSELIYIFISSVVIGTIVYMMTMKTFYNHIFGEIKLLLSEVRRKTIKN